MKFGYCRVSTAHQKLERQIDNIRDAFPDVDRIYTEKFTGTKIERPEFEKLLKRIRPGDTIIFDSVSRMSRNAEEGMELYEQLYNDGITLVFLKEPHISTDVYRQALETQISMTGNEIADEYIKATNRVLMILAKQQVKMAFGAAEKEVIEKRACVSEGIKKVQEANIRHIQMGETDQVKQIGQRIGAKLTTQKSIAAKKVILEHSRDFGGTLDDGACMKLVGLARNSFYKYKRELKAEGAGA